MKIRQGFSLHQLGDEYIVIHDGTTNIDFDKLLSLNPTAAFLWKSIGHEAFDTDRLTALLTDNYEVSAGQARQDAEAFIGKLVETGITEE